MNIYTVRDNLKNTIAGKEGSLRVLKMTIPPDNEIKQMAMVAMQHIHQEHIDELRRILQDVEQCCEQAVAASWANEDRQGGI
jgi:hypothetical protein